MKWMLVVLVFGVSPMETGLVYNSLDECLKNRGGYASRVGSRVHGNAENVSGNAPDLTGLCEKTDDQRHLHSARRAHPLNRARVWQVYNCHLC